MKNDAASQREGDSKNGVQSLEIGMTILQAISSGHRSMMLKDIAAAADMPASKVHRYIVSLVRSGLVEQDPMTSRYDLGPFALSLGLVAVDRLDRVKLGLTTIADLRDEINQTTALAIWSDNGPVIIRSVRPYRPITVNVVTGTALHLLTSASGRVFAAWLPESTTRSHRHPGHARSGAPGGCLHRVRLPPGSRCGRCGRPHFQFQERNHPVRAGHWRQRNDRSIDRRTRGDRASALGADAVVAPGVHRKTLRHAPANGLSERSLAPICSYFHSLLRLSGKPISHF